MPADWGCLAWKTGGGYANQASNGNGVVNKHRERVWFSPHCLTVEKIQQLTLIGD
jgi:hypothetical protein